MKKTKKLLSILLAVLIILSVFSCATNVFAEEYNEYVDDKAYEEKLLTETVDSEEEKAEIVCEVEEKRDEFSKTYKRADGSYTTVVSQVPLHAQKNGEWEEIDNTLKTEHEAIKNTAGSFDIEFPETISENEKITISNNGESVAFSINNIDSSAAVISTHEADNKDIIEEALSKTVSEITYESIDESTDVQYVVSSGSVKENIIVNDKAALKDTYSFDIEKGDLSAVLDDENNLVFKNEKNEIVFTIPAPVMTDAKNAVSYDIDVAVSNADKSVLTLTYTPSKEWLESSDRVYPVVIDPVITLESSKEIVIEDTTIMYTSDDEDSINTNYVNSPFGFIADTGTIENNDLIKGNVLVKFNMDVFEGFKTPGAAVTDVNYVASGNVLGGNILAKPINGSWDCATITYDDVYPTDGSAPVITYEDKVVDYFTGLPLNTEADEAYSMYFNITDLFNQWLKDESNNRGFALVPETSNVNSMIITGGYIETSYKGTIKRTYYDSYCTIDYVDTTGSNDKFEYLTQEIGRAGTASVNTFSRALSLNRTDLSMDGLRMPASVGFNYNHSALSFIDIASNVMQKIDSDYENFKIPYGNNWFPSCLQCLTALSENEYQFFTSEGTLVTFYPKEETIGEGDNTTTEIVFETDETSDSGYTLELIDQQDGIDFCNMKMISPDGKEMYFSDIGTIYGIIDPEHSLENSSDDSYNGIFIIPNEDNPFAIDYVLDGIGRKYDFIYNEETGLLSEIKCLTAAGEAIKAGSTETELKVTYGYDSNGNLTTVTYPDGKSVAYTYSGDNLVKIQNIDNYNIQYTYDSLGKVTKITEKSGNTTGNFITLEELNTRQVKITDTFTGVEIQQFGKDGRLHYTFDDKGNFYKSDYAPANEDVLTANGWMVEPENLLKNGSFDTTSENSPKEWDDCFPIEIADIDNVYDNFCKVYSESSATKLQSQIVDVDGGKDFTFSLYAKHIGEKVKTTDKLYLNIIAVDEDEEETSKAIQITPTNEFKQYSVSVSTETETDYVIVEFGLKRKTGNFLVNNAQLERGKGTAEFNYIENGTFTYLENNVPDNWSNSTIVTDSINGESVNAVKLTGGLPSYNGDVLNDSISAVTQTVKINGKKDEIYSVGGWFKGLFDDNYINPNFMPEYSTTISQLTNSTAQIKVTYSYTDTVSTTDETTNETTTTEQTITENFAVDFTPHNNGWQYATDSFALKADVATVDVTIMTKNLPNDSFTTNISLIKEFDGEIFEDDSEDEETTASTCSCGCEDCAYGENCPCTGAINNECQCPECLRKDTTTEDDFGNILSNKSTDGIKYIETLSAYTQDGNYLTRYTDERGNETTYDYNTLNGILEAVTSSMGTGNEETTTSYEYDAMGNVVSVSTDNKTLEYVYTNDRLTEIITPNGKFEIIYDAWGQVLSVNVVNTDGNLVPLVEYTYNANAFRTQIDTVTYPNSATNNKTYQYSYSSDGNITEIYINNVKKHNITYSNLGELTEIKNIGGRTVRYTEDDVYIYNADDTLVYSSVTDSEGNVTEENFGIKYKEQDAQYNYDAQTGSSTNTTGLDIANYYRIEQAAKTDWFGREESHLTTIYDISDETETTPAEVVGKISTEYEYPIAEDGKTSSAIEKYVNKTYNGNSETVRVFDGYSYEYDKQNKISAIKKLNASGAETEMYSYEYDKLGQLVRYNDKVANKSYTYTYDNNGNILTKSEYAYTTGALGAATTTNYVYDTQWKDKLTTVGDKTITYDNIGNPTNYLGATLTWEGRQLKSYETEEQKLQFEYDENGMRYRTTSTNKEDNSVGYLDYVWVDSKLISISFTSDELNQTVKYLYNDFDEPVGFVSTREDGSVDTYYYLKNAQGDITNIVSAAGKKMVEFTYDAFGKRTVTYQANGSTIPGQIELLTQMKVDMLNPFSYRGYCYDYDMGMYYLQSRYYDPNTGRFINADDTNYLNATGTVLSCNLFAYCENDPVNFVDIHGYKKISIADAIIVLCMANESILTAPLSGEILPTISNVKTDYSIYKLKDKKSKTTYKYYSFSLFAYTNKWYKSERYEVLCFGATVYAWNHLCNKVDTLLKSEGVVGGIGTASKFLSKIYTASKYLKILIKISKYLAVPLAIVCAVVGDVKNSIESKIESKDGNKWYQFNWYVKYTYGGFMQNPTTTYLTAYCLSATLT